MLSFFRELDRRDPLLARLGWLLLALLGVMVALARFDDRTILGLNPWVKPSKFAVSITIYIWSIAWFLEYITGPRWAKRLIRWGTAVTMIVEMICIAGQSLRGTTSHFNHATPLDGAVFSTMGLMIQFSTLLDVLLLALLFLRQVSLPPAYLWGVRCGLIGLIVCGGSVGVILVVNLAHTVGGPDGGPGLAILNWSTQWGDLRVAHALGLHSLQLLPLVGYWLSKHRPRIPTGVQLAGVAAAAALYWIVFAAVLWQALAGHPLVAASGVV